MNAKIFQLAKIRSGAILPLAVIMVVILFIIGLAVLQLGLNARLQAIRAQRVIMARMAADAGMAKAIEAMRKKLIDEYVWNNSTLPTETDVAVPQSGQSYTYAVTGDPCNGWNITSTGTAGATQRTVHCKLEVKSAWFGIAVKRGINIKYGTIFGTYPAPGGSLTLRTNTIETAGVALKAGVTVPGDVICGPGGDPAKVIDTKASTVIKGDTYAANEEIEFPPVVVPQDLVALSPSTFPNSSVVQVKGNVKYNSLTIGGSQTLVIWNDPNTPGGDASRIYIAGKLILMNGAKIVVDNGASAKLYLGGNLEDKNSASSGGGFDTTANPDARSFMIFATDSCTSIVLKSKGNFYGAIYAPNADLQINNDADLYGAYVGNQNVEIKNSGSFFFDTRLASVFVDDAAAYFAVTKGSWWEE
jgi:hypothetical protein